MKPRCIVLAVAVLSAGSAAQAKPDAKPTDWPKATDRDKRAVRAAIKRLENDDEGVVAAARERILSVGPGAAPVLFQKLASARLPNPDAITGLLDALLTPDHAPLLVKYATRRQVPVRLYVVMKFAEFHDPETRPVLEKAVKDKDAEVAFWALVGLCALGDLEHLDVVFDRCREAWRTIGARVGTALQAQRGKQATAAVAARMADDDEELDVVTGLRLLRSVAPKDYARRIGRYLDSRHANVKREAINALRVIVDGDEPLEKLSVFDAITHAQRWKARL